MLAPMVVMVMATGDGSDDEKAAVSRPKSETESLRVWQVRPKRDFPRTQTQFSFLPISSTSIGIVNAT